MGLGVIGYAFLGWHSQCEVLEAVVGVINAGKLISKSHV
jgi:hypothetical protein